MSVMVYLPRNRIGIAVRRPRVVILVEKTPPDKLYRGRDIKMVAKMLAPTSSFMIHRLRLKKHQNRIFKPEDSADILRE